MNSQPQAAVFLLISIRRGQLRVWIDCARRAEIDRRMRLRINQLRETDPITGLVFLHKRQSGSKMRQLERRANEKRRPKAAPMSSDREPDLLDLGFLEFDVLLDDRVVFAERHFFGLRAAVLARHVEEAGIGCRQKLDLEFCSLGHLFCPLDYLEFLPPWHGKNPEAENLPRHIKNIARKSSAGSCQGKIQVDGNSRRRREVGRYQSRRSTRRDAATVM
jgi:hypothetical protein